MFTAQNRYLHCNVVNKLKFEGQGGSKILTFFFGKGVGGWKMYDFFLEPPLCDKLSF
jgi:hypothetical protein